jgi:hypothetical protein
VIGRIVAGRGIAIVGDVDETVAAASNLFSPPTKMARWVGAVSS